MMANSTARPTLTLVPPGAPAADREPQRSDVQLLATLLGSGTSDDLKLGASAPNELRWMAEIGVLARF